MPNHVTTTVKMSGPSDVLAAFKAAHIRPDGADEQHLDFETLIPMPEILKGIESGSRTDGAIEKITGQPPDPYGFGAMFRKAWTPKQHADHQARLDALTPEELAAGQRSLDALAQTGSANWYDWNCAHWGTKWNSYHFEVLTDVPTAYEFRMETAWSVPTPIFAEIAARYPDLHFDTASFDEGWNFAASGVGHEGEYDAYTEDPKDRNNYYAAYGEYPPKDEDEEDDDDTADTMPTVN